MATPPSTAIANTFSVMMPGRSNPRKPQITIRVTAPKRHRQNTTPLTGWPDMITNQPIVPEISIAAVISAVPLRMSFCIIRLPVYVAILLR
jgi:hypothetical protein